MNNLWLTAARTFAFILETSKGNKIVFTLSALFLYFRTNCYDGLFIIPQKYFLLEMVTEVLINHIKFLVKQNAGIYK